MTRLREWAVEKIGVWARLGVLALAGAMFGVWRWQWPEFGAGTYQVALVGTILDIVFILFVFELFQSGKTRQQDIKRQKDIIEDYKRWDSAEARFRLAGAIRRLARLGVHKIDFSGAQISDFEFCYHGIESLAGSSFYDGTLGGPTRQTAVRLRNIAFDHVDCQDVMFSFHEPLLAFISHKRREATLTDCSFRECNLTGARFKGAALEWTTPPPASHYEEIDQEDDGRPIFAQVSVGPFCQADLTGTNFEDARFENADFRDAENIDKAHFKGATGLESCIFDAEEIKQDILAMARAPKREAVG